MELSSAGLGIQDLEVSCWGWFLQSCRSGASTSFPSWDSVEYGLSSQGRCECPPCPPRRPSPTIQPYNPALTYLLPGQGLPRRYVSKGPALYPHSDPLPKLNSAGPGWPTDLPGGEGGPLSKATQFSHSLSLCQEPPQKKSTPKLTAGCSQQTPLWDLHIAEWPCQKSGDWAVHSPGWCCNNRSTCHCKGGVCVSSRLISLFSPRRTESPMIFTTRC